MKKICLLIIILSVLVAGCENKSIEKQKGFNESKTYSLPESKEKFSITYPDWEAAESDDPFNNITLKYGQCIFALNIIDAPPQWYEKAVEGFVKNSSGTILSEYPLSYTLTANGYTFKTQTNASFCNDKTYFVFYTCLESQFDEKKSRDIFDSKSCKRE